MMKKSIHSVSATQGFMLVISLILLFQIVIYIDDILPHDLSLRDEKDFPESFITERARHDLKVLTSVGPRVVGSYENEVFAVEFLTQELIRIKDAAHEVHSVDIDVQTVSGSYYLNYRPFGAFNSYGNVQNVIVKLHARNESAKSILVNAHFDSVPSSPGGSDDGINCVVMMEILRKLTKLPNRPQHNVIFLFNGAEETPMQASHGFITQHKWAESVKVIVNLEAAGSGGKEILFQTGPGHSWLLGYYARVPHPYGQAAGEEIFQSNLIPSDTDFRVFRDFGNTVGYDLAFAKNGYRYHTSYDDFDSIPPGSYQHVGDNALALIKSLANAPEIDHLTERKDKAVYYDIFGLFMVHYGETAAVVINMLVALFSFLVAFKSLMDFKLGCNRRTLKFLALVFTVTILSWVFAPGIIYLIALAVDVSRPMSWYTKPITISGLYSLPTIICLSLPIVLLNKYFPQVHNGINVTCQVQSHVIRLIFTIILMLGTIFGIRAVYAFIPHILFTSIAYSVISIGNLQHSVNKWRLIYLLSTVLPTMLTFYQMILILSLFIPITGRIGSDINPEVIIGLITCLMTIVFSSYYVHFVIIVRNPSKLIYGLLSLVVFTCIFIATPLGFPYSGNPEAPSPQRHMLYHTKRIFHGIDGSVKKQDSGYVVLNLDRNSPGSVESYVSDFTRRTSIVNDCNESLVCGLPLITPRMLQIMKQIVWIPSEDPILDDNTELKLNNRINITPNILQYNFTVTGPDHLNVYLSTRNRTKLLKINLSHGNIPESVSLWNGRPIYFINYVWGKTNAPLNLYFDVEIMKGHSGPVVDVAVSGKYVHRINNSDTVNFMRFVNSFPRWANVIPAKANFESWIFS